MKKTFAIIFVSFFVLLAGICVAYYNTGSLLYDEIYVFSYNGDSVTFLDYTLSFDSVNCALNKIRSVLPQKPVSFCIYI